MTNERDDLIDEAVLRRSLRFEPDEHTPRFDAAAIAAMAEDQARRPRTMAILLAAAGVTGVAAGSVWSLIASNAPAIGDAVGGATLGALIALATLLVPLAELASQPTVPLSLLAAIAVAIVHELRERRETAHVHAS